MERQGTPVASPLSAGGKRLVLTAGLKPIAIGAAVALTAALAAAPAVAVEAESVPTGAVVEAGAAQITQLSGNCGAQGQESTVRWALSQNGTNEAGATYTLNISGSGVMADYIINGTDASGVKIEDNRPWAAAKDAITEVRISDGVTSLGDYAFANFTNLTKANMPASVMDMGISLFLNDTSLTDFKWATGYDAPSLKDEGATAGDYSGKYLPFGMFDNCSSLGEGVDLLTWLPSSYVGVGTAALRGTAFKVDLSRWGNLSYVGPYAFASMKNLTGTVIVKNEWTFGLRGEKDKDPSSAAFRASGVERVVFEKGVKAVPKYSFESCDKLSSVIFADDTTSIGSWAFVGTTSLKSVDFKNVTTIGGYAFKDSGLTNVVVPEKVTSLGERAFEGCKSLTAIDFKSKDLSYVGNLALTGCAKLKTITVSKGATVAKLTNDQFRAESNGTYPATEPMTLVLDGTVKNLDVRLQNSITDVIADGANNKLGYTTLPKSLVNLTVVGDSWAIPANAFANWQDKDSGVTTPTALKTLTVLSKKVTDSKTDAFRGTGLEYVRFTGEVSLGNQAFVNCYNLESVDFSSADVKSVGSNLFGGVTTNFGLYLKDETARTTIFNGKYANSTAYVVNDGFVDLYARHGFAAVMNSGKKGTWYKWNATSSEGQKVDAPVDKVNNYGVKWSDAKSSVSGDLDFGEVVFEGKAGSKKLTVGYSNATSVTCESELFTCTPAADGKSIEVAPAANLSVGMHEAEVRIATKDGATHIVTAIIKVSPAAVTNTGAERTVAYADGLAVDAASLFKIDPNAGEPEFIIEAADGAKVEGDVIRVTKPGTYTVKMTTEASGNYAAGDKVEATLTVTKAAPTVSVAVNGESSLEVTGSTTVKVAAEVKGGPTDAAATITCDNGDAKRNGDGTWSLPNKTATYTFTASYAGDENHEAASAAATVKVTRKSTGGNGGGGTVTPTPTPSGSAVTLPSVTDGGKVSSDKATAKAGETVTLTVTPDKGHRTSKVRVTDEAGKKVKVAYADGKYTFTMPEGKVSVSVEFKANDARNFADNQADTWFRAAVEEMSAKGVMNGYGDGTYFGVGHALTRGEFAALLHNWAQPGLADADDENETKLADVADGQFYTSAANWAVANGIINGVDNPDGTRSFAPDQPVTLEQMCVIIGNLVDRDAASTADTSELAKYVDGAQVSPWAEHYVAWASEVGLFSGSVEQDGLHVRGGESIMRERVAGVLSNAFKNGILK